MLPISKRLVRHFWETVDDDDLTSDEEIVEEEENDALDEVNALMMFDRSDDEH